MNVHLCVVRVDIWSIPASSDATSSGQGHEVFDRALEEVRTTNDRHQRTKTTIEDVFTFLAPYIIARWKIHEHADIVQNLVRIDCLVSWSHGKHLL